MGRSRYSRARSVLRNAGAPSDLLDYFDAQVRHHEKFVPSSAATPMELLIQACRKFAFTKPFIGKMKQPIFRPSVEGNTFALETSDTAPAYSDPAAPIIEQAYRRGYDQGFGNVIYLLRQGLKLDQLISKEREIRYWRFAPVQELGSTPGSDETVDFGLDDRSKIGASLRWKILKRDSFRCQICGSSQEDDVTLHVDHKTSLFDGGTSEEENLWTLCEQCNLGKGRESI